MKYPNHLILDLQTPSIGNPCSVSWEKSFYDSDIKLFTAQHTTLTPSSQRSRISRPTLRQTQFFNGTLFDIHFLRRERLYTKLKYSRCPQYDIVSGGFAALLAGFIGFLISEKFGIELVDSGDFYIAFMYAVFAVFSIRPLILSYCKYDTPYNPFSLKYIYIFFSDVLYLALR